MARKGGEKAWESRGIGTRKFGKAGERAGEKASVSGRGARERVLRELSRAASTSQPTSLSSPANPRRFRRQPTHVAFVASQPPANPCRFRRPCHHANPRRPFRRPFHLSFQLCVPENGGDASESAVPGAALEDADICCHPPGLPLLLRRPSKSEKKTRIRRLCARKSRKSSLSSSALFSLARSVTALNERLPPPPLPSLPTFNLLLLFSFALNRLLLVLFFALNRSSSSSSLPSSFALNPLLLLTLLFRA